MNFLLVDDHPLFLEGLQNLLRSHKIDVVGLARDGFEALAQVRALHPDVVLMDVRMPKCDGLAATRLIKCEFPDVRIVMLSMSADDDNLFEAIRVGASGYLLKTQDGPSFFKSLEELARGEVALAPGLARRVLNEFARLREAFLQNGSTPNTPDLSPRQAQILALVARDMTYKKIGDQLGLAERTVKYHMGEILTLLHLSNRADAAAYARQHGMSDRS